MAGKPPLEGLPATFSAGDVMCRDVEGAKNALEHEEFSSGQVCGPLKAGEAGTSSDVMTLEITLRDAVLGLRALLRYSVFADCDALARSVTLFNDSEQTVVLDKVMSFSMDMDDDGYRLLTLHGSWAREREMEMGGIRYGKQSVGSVRGESSHQEHPFIALCSGNTTQETGEVYALRKENPGQLVMIRQFRYPVNGYLYELPAGLIDPGETPVMSAVREMKEETGLDFSVYEGGDPCYRNPFFMAQGLTDESGVMVYGYASGEISSLGQEDSEEIEVLYVDQEMAKRLLREERLSMRAAFHLMHFIHADLRSPFSFLD